MLQRKTDLLYWNLSVFIFATFPNPFLGLCLNVFFQTGDRSGELTARMNVSDLQTVLGLSYSTNNSTISENKDIDYNLHGRVLPQLHSCSVTISVFILYVFCFVGAKPRLSRRHSMENLELMQLTPDKMNVSTA